jgi:PAS domain S-box-containing protein
MAGGKQSKRELLECERAFRLLVQGVTDYAIYMLDPNGIVSNWNSGAEKIKGYKAKEIVGKHFSVFYTPEEQKAGLPARALEKARKEKRFIAEGWRVRKGGTRFFASVVIDPIYEKRKLIGATSQSDSRLSRN